MIVVINQCTLQCVMKVNRKEEQENLIKIFEKVKFRTLNSH